MRRERKHLQKICPKTLSKSHLQCLLCPTTHGSSDNLIYIFINLLCIPVLSANIEIQGGWSYLSVVPSIPIQKSISLQTTLFCPGSFLASVSVGVCCLLLSSVLLLIFRKKTPFLQIRQFFTSFNIWISCQHIPPVHCIFFVRTIVKVSPLRNYKESNPRNLVTSEPPTTRRWCVRTITILRVLEVDWRLNMGERGVNRKEPTHNTTEAEVVKSLQYCGAKSKVAFFIFCA